MPINTAVNPPEYWAPFINVKCSHPLCLKACQAEFSDVFLSSTIVFAPQKLLCQSFFFFFLMHCCNTEVPAVLFIFYHNDKLQFVLLYFTALRSISTMQRDNDPTISSLGASFNKKQFLVVGLQKCRRCLCTDTHTHRQTHDSAI